VKRRQCSRSPRIPHVWGTTRCIILVFGALFASAVLFRQSTRGLFSLLRDVSFSQPAAKPNIFCLIHSRQASFVPLERGAHNVVRICMYNSLASKVGLEQSSVLLLDSSCTVSSLSLFSLGFVNHGGANNYSGRSIVHTDLQQLSLESFVESQPLSILIVNEPPRVDGRPYLRLRSDPSARRVGLILHAGSTDDLPVPNALPWPIVESWIPIHMWGKYEKTRSCSIIASDKRGDGGYNLRHEVIEAIIQHGFDCDIFGGKFRPLAPERDADQLESGYHAADVKWTKIRGLQDYRFTIVIENSLSHGRYFTEKLLDALAVGTVPVYWGTPFAQRVFQTAIIPFQNVDELLGILPTLTEARFQSLESALSRARTLARWFASPENFLWSFCVGCSLPAVVSAFEDVDEYRSPVFQATLRDLVLSELHIDIAYRRELNLTPSVLF
jgi:Glycosyltransferase family 10 (fucosyltransferase) C-term